MQTYGINVGHGHCKAVVNDGVRETMMEVFPSQIAHAGDTGELGTAQVVYVDRRPYLVGDDADLGAPITDTTQARLDNPTLIPALVGGGVQRLGITQSGVCVSCLPATWITSQEKKAALGARLREGAAGLFQPTYVISEPQAALFSLLLDVHGAITDEQGLATGRVGIVDIGAATVDIATLSRLNQEPGSVKTWKTGLTRALETIRIHLETELDRDVTLHQADMAVRQREIAIAGQLQALPEGWEQPLIQVGESIVADLRKVWGAGRHLDTVLLSGGVNYCCQISSFIAPNKAYLMST